MNELDSKVLALTSEDVAADGARIRLNCVSMKPSNATSHVEDGADPMACARLKPPEREAAWLREPCSDKKDAQTSDCRTQPVKSAPKVLDGCTAAKPKSPMRPAIFWRRPRTKQPLVTCDGRRSHEHRCAESRTTVSPQPRTQGRCVSQRYHPRRTTAGSKEMRPLMQWSAVTRATRTI